MLDEERVENDIPIHASLIRFVGDIWFQYRYQYKYAELEKIIRVWMEGNMRSDCNILVNPRYQKYDMLAFFARYPEHCRRVY